MSKTNPKIVIIGGGTGTFNVLSGLKNYPLDLSVIVTMADSGGSNRVIRNEFGLLPTSDVRQCVVALADENENNLLRQLFTYRFTQGIGISGMTFGNLFMAALANILGTQKAAIKETCQLFNIKGNILPVTYEKSNLVAKYQDGTTILGEHEIDEPDNRNPSRIIKLRIFPQVKANPEAVKAIKAADWIIIGPGDLYTSLICNLVVRGISKAIDQSSAQILYILNLMTRAGQTLGFSASDHLKEINRYLGEKKITHTLINQSDLPKDALQWYAQIGVTPVKDDLSKTKYFSVIRSNIVSKNLAIKSKADILTRSLIRHDPLKLAKSIYTIITNNEG